MLNPVEEWREDDGIRSLEDPWAYTSCLFQILRDLEIPWVEIGDEMKDLNGRVKLVKTYFYDTDNPI